MPHPFSLNTFARAYIAILHIGIGSNTNSVKFMVIEIQGLPVQETGIKARLSFATGGFASLLFCAVVRLFRTPRPV